MVLGGFGWFRVLVVPCFSNYVKIIIKTVQ